MEIAEETQGTTLVVRPAGRLDRTTSPELERLLLARIEGGAARLLIDFAGIEYVSSAGLRVVLVAGKRVKAANGALALCSLRPAIREVFDISGFATLFPIHPDAAAALAAAG
ncbi:MAG: STAS domain-containing protein [Dongiaceae bacterium]